MFFSWGRVRSVKKDYEYSCSECKIIWEKAYKFGNPADKTKCPLCGKRPRSGKDICPVCRNLRDVGAALPKSNLAGWLPTQNGPSDSFSYPWGLSFRLSRDISGVPADCFPAYINKYSAGFPLVKTPYHVPTNDTGEILTFEKIG